MFGHRVNIIGLHLISFSYSSGGGMNGGYNRMTVTKDGENAVIATSEADWHGEELKEKKYTVSAEILNELEAVVRKYKMNNWHEKKFTDIFVCDGESESYCFDFGEETVRFSSQFYPAEYAGKLRELFKVIEKYISTAK